MKDSQFIIPEVEGWFTPKDIESYRALVSQIPQNGILAELGTWKGRSLCSIADIVKERNLKVYAIDTFKGTENEGDAHKEAKEIDLKAEFEANIAKYGLTDYVSVNQMTTLEAASSLEITPDMVFVDADHSEEAVFADIQSWKKKIATGGRIAGHDWVWESVRSAVWKSGININTNGNLWYEGDLYPNRTFSVCFIARNEAKCLPRALASLEEFKAKGGEVCLVDTGSTDDTAKVAREWGCKVEEVGDKFKIIIDQKLADDINGFFIEEGEADCVTTGESLFKFNEARNYVANMASNEMVMFFDCDEACTVMDIDRINHLIRQGADQFEYDFVFSHDQYGKPDVEFIQSKFYNKNKFFWTNYVHEVLAVVPEVLPEIVTPVIRIDSSVYRLEHWQNVETNRVGYLKGLALDCYLNQNNDRNSHYFSRELLWHGRLKSAIKEFKRHLTISWWAAERGQSMIYIGDCFLGLGDEKQAKEWYIKGYEEEPARREALMRLADMAYKKNDYQRCASYCAAALEIPWSSFYANIRAHFTHLPHELLYWAKWYLNDKEGSRYHFNKALEFQPENGKYLHDYRFYYNLPKVSFIIPHLSLGIKEREEGLAKCLESIKDLNYPQELIETLVEEDEPRIGVPKRVKSLYEKSTGEYIVYASNDTVFEHNSLMQAIVMINREGLDLCAFNTGELSPDKGNQNEHFIIRRVFVNNQLNGEIFDLRYFHVGCDNLLWARADKWGLVNRCELAKVTHNHFSTTGTMDAVYELAWNEEQVKHDRELLAKDLKELDEKYGY